MHTEEVFPSPEGKYVFRISPWEVRMSLWVETPELIEVETGKALVSFQDSHWSLNKAEWSGPESVRIWIRKYPGDHLPAQFTAVLDCEKEVAVFDDGERVRFERLESVFEARYEKGRNSRR